MTLRRTGFWRAAARTTLFAIALGPLGHAASAADLAPSSDILLMAGRVTQARDNAGRPFIVIDKPQARLWVFDAQGQALAQTAVLLGLARGDLSVPGIGEREMRDIRPEERTTPAGRFIAEPGVNADGEDVFWIDYDSAISMHRVRATNPAEHRLERLATPTAGDNRISYGCINVPARFYDARIKPLFGKGQGVVYLLPDVLSKERVFPGLLAARQPR